MNNTRRAHLSLLIANLIYAANFTIAKAIMPLYIKPFGFVLIRVIGACILFWLVHPFFIKEKVARKDIYLLAVCSVFGITINQLLFFKGLSITTPINAALIMITSPILVLVIANLLIREVITYSKTIGIFLGACGAAVLILFGKDVSTHILSSLGDIYIFINALSWGTFLVIVKPLMVKYHPITVTKWVFLFGLLFVTPFGYSELMEVEWSSFTMPVWSGVAYVVIGTTFFAYLFNIFPLKMLNASVASSYIYLQPVLATIIAISFGKDRLNYIQVLSAFMIFSGLFLVSRPSHKNS